MQWKLSIDRYGLESQNYRIRPHPLKNGRWIAAIQFYTPGAGMIGNGRVVFGAYNTTNEAKQACERHSQGQPIATDTKPCRLCGVVKPLGAYSKHYGDRLKTACKPCLNAQSREYKARAKRSG
jgi:hypothetical protein